MRAVELITLLILLVNIFENGDVSRELVFPKLIKKEISFFARLGFSSVSWYPRSRISEEGREDYLPKNSFFEIFKI